MLAWGRTSYDVFASLAASEPDAGVRMLHGTEVVASRDVRPWWAEAVPDLRESAEGWSFTAPVVEMPLYLAWLASRVVDLGGSLTRMNLQALPAPIGSGEKRHRHLVPLWRACLVVIVIERMGENVVTEIGAIGSEFGIGQGFVAADEIAR